jgi:putative FmdB family regulatory protein
VATYRYRCSEHGPHDAALPIGTAPATRSCPSCGAPAARVFTAPMLGRASRVALAAHDATRVTAETPAVVSSPPPRPGGTPAAASPNPAWRRLPKP